MREDYKACVVASVKSRDHSAKFSPYLICALKYPCCSLAVGHNFGKALMRGMLIARAHYLNCNRKELLPVFLPKCMVYTALVLVHAHPYAQFSLCQNTHAQVMHGGSLRLGHLFACLPTTYTLPREAAAWADAVAKAAKGVEASVVQPKGCNLW